MGDPVRLGVAAEAAQPPFQMTRGVEPGGHEGADLSNRRGGDPVRAAAPGLVVTAGERPGDGFGVRVVIAHREADGRVVYSVYSHLAAGTAAVTPGETVALGQVIGRVGMTGRATSPHLHFEVRVPELPDARWEKAPVVDPVAFVEARLPDGVADTSWAREVLVWGESAGLLAPGLDPGSPMPRAEWWCALAAAGGVGGDTLTRDPALARRALADAGVIDPRRERDSDAPPGWKEIAHDLARLRRFPPRLPPMPEPPARIAARCHERFEVEHPRDPAGYARLDREPPTRAEAMLLLAATAAPRPVTHRASRRRRHRPATTG